jgi:hypothetical protein
VTPTAAVGELAEAAEVIPTQNWPPLSYRFGSGS